MKREFKVGDKVIGDSRGIHSFLFKYPFPTQVGHINASVGSICATSEPSTILAIAKNEEDCNRNAIYILTANGEFGWVNEVYLDHVPEPKKPEYKYYEYSQPGRMPVYVRATSQHEANVYACDKLLALYVPWAVKEVTAIAIHRYHCENAQPYRT